MYIRIYYMFKNNFMFDGRQLNRCAIRILLRQLGLDLLDPSLHIAEDPFCPSIHKHSIRMLVCFLVKSGKRRCFSFLSCLQKFEKLIMRSLINKLLIIKNEEIINTYHFYGDPSFLVKRINTSHN